MTHIRVWLKITLTCLLIVYMPVSAAAVWFTSCEICSTNTNSIFAGIKVGDYEAHIIDEMGSPSNIAPPFDDEYYISNTCENECARRYYYRSFLCLDKTWVIEFDKDNKVVNKYYLFSL